MIERGGDRGGGVIERGVIEGQGGGDRGEEVPAVPRIGDI